MYITKLSYYLTIAVSHKDNVFTRVHNRLKSKCEKLHKSYSYIYLVR